MDHTTSGNYAHVETGEGVAEALELLSLVRERIECASPASETFFDQVLPQLLYAQPAQAATIDALSAINHYFVTIKRPATESAAAEVAKARELGDPRRLSRALRTLSWAATDAGEFGTAIASGIESVTLAESSGLLCDAASAWNILGSAFIGTSQYVLARACFGRCIATGSNSELAREYHECAAANLFTIHLIQGNLEEAADTAAWLAGQLERAEVRGDVVSRAEQALLHVSVAEAMIAAGNLQFAESQIARASNLLGPMPVRSRASVGLGYVQALLKVARGEQVSLDFIMATLDTDPSDFSSLYATVSIFESIGQFDTALQLLRKLSDQSKRRYISSVSVEQRILEGCVQLPLGLDVNDFGSRSIRLEAKTHERIDSLLHLAISASIAAGATSARIFRVAKLAALVGRDAGLSEGQLRSLDLAAKLYDIGMIAIDVRLLGRQTALTEAERLVVMDHVRFGADLLMAAKLELLAPCIPVARFHHERWDGSGPNGLKAEEIPVEARLIALCDSFDALTQPRPWRPAYSRHDAIALIRNEAKGHFDPALCEIFIGTIAREALLRNDLTKFLEEDASESQVVVLQTAVEHLLGIQEY